MGGLQLLGGGADVGELTARLDQVALGDWSDGENVLMFSSAVSPRKGRILDGTAAKPVEAVGPTFAVSRKEKLTVAQIEAVGGAGSDGADVVAAFKAMSEGHAGSETQTVALYAGAKNKSNAAGGNPDACALYAIGNITGGNAPKATAIAITAIGRREAGVTADVSGMELNCHNRAAAGSYAAAGASDTKAMWVNALGTADSGCGIQFGNVVGRKFKVGIGFNSQNGGGVADSTLRDDGTATVCLDVRGTHSQAVKVAENAGHLEVNAKPVFLGNGLAGVLAPHGTVPFGTSGVAVAANRAYLARFIPARTFNATKIAFATTVAAGSNDACDVGLYNEAGERLVSAGATVGVLNASPGIQVISIPSTQLIAGRTYYAAISTGAIGSTVAQIAMVTASGSTGDLLGTTAGTRMLAIQASAHPLPSTATLAAAGQQVPLLAVRE